MGSVFGKFLCAGVSGIGLSGFMPRTDIMGLPGMNLDVRKLPWSRSSIERCTYVRPFPSLPGPASIAAGITVIGSDFLSLASFHVLPARLHVPAVGVKQDPLIPEDEPHRGK